MFSLREFIKQGFLDAVGKMADYQIILNATAYYEKQVLTLEDLAEIKEAIDKKNTPVEPEITEDATDIGDGSIEEPTEPVEEVNEEAE